MAFDQIVVKGTTSKMIEVMLRRSDTGQGKTGLAFGDVTAYYMREGASAAQSITLQSATLGTYSSGGWVEVDATNLPGLYQFGIPDAALADGADAVTLSFNATDTMQRSVRIVLLGSDLRNMDALADSLLQRPLSDVEDAAVFRTLAGAAAKLTNRVRLNGASLEIYKTDDATILATQAASTDSGQDPIIEVDTD